MRFQINYRLFGGDQASKKLWSSQSINCLAIFSIFIFVFVFIFLSVRWNYTIAMYGRGISFVFIYLDRFTRARVRGARRPFATCSAVPTADDLENMIFFINFGIFHFFFRLAWLLAGRLLICAQSYANKTHIKLDRLCLWWPPKSLSAPFAQCDLAVSQTFQSNAFKNRFIHIFGKIGRIYGEVKWTNTHTSTLDRPFRVHKRNGEYILTEIAREIFVSVIVITSCPHRRRRNEKFTCERNWGARTQSETNEFDCVIWQMFRWNGQL